ncbi:MAG: hypothetical protein KBG85_19125, partial [Micropruina sp.]|nr:hypothetical protein [Micropruina sp.]
MTAREEINWPPTRRLRWPWTHGNGLAAPALAQVPWVRAARLLYWGDLDTYGLSILSMVRQALPQAESLLMDTATLL